MKILQFSCRYDFFALIHKVPFFRKIKSLLSLLILSLMVSACGSSSSGSGDIIGDGSDNDDNNAPVFESIEVSNSNESGPFVVGQTIDLSASLISSDGSIADMDDSNFEWESSSPSIATVSSEGIVEAVSPGTAAITVARDNLAFDFEISIDARSMTSLELVVDSSTIPIGNSVMLSVFGIFNDDTREELNESDSITIESSDVSVAEVDPELFGRIVSNGLGDVTFSVETDAGLASSVSLEVTPAVITDIMLSSETLTIPAGFSTELSAVGTFSDGTQKDVTSDVVWSVKGVQNADVSPVGVLTALEPGLATINADFNNVSTELDIEVTEATLESIEIVSSGGSLAVGQQNSLSILGTFSDETTNSVEANEWGTSDASVLSVNENGLVEGVSEGTVTVTAGVSSLTATAEYTVTSAVLEKIDVSFPNLSNGSLAAGLEATAQATATFSDDSKSNLTDRVVWQSSDSSVAAVSADGSITAVSPGVADITATYEDTLGVKELDVTDAILQSVSIDSKNLSDGRLSGSKGLKQKVELLGQFSDGSDSILNSGSISWSVDDSSIASINTDSEVQFLAVGSTMLTGQSQDLVDTIILETTEAEPVEVEIAGINSPVPAGESADLTATFILSDSTISEITDSVDWESSEPSVATIGDSGKNTSVLQPTDAGFTTITAETTIDGRLVTGSVDLEVLTSTLQIERFNDGIFDSGFSSCGSLGDGGSGCSISSTQSMSILPTPEWFTLDTFRITAEGRDWTVAETNITQAGSAVTRVVGIESGAVIPEGSSVDVEVQIQSTGGVQESEIFQLNVISNDGGEKEAIKGNYTVTTN